MAETKTDKDPYAILGIARTATAEEIRAAYRKLAKKHHPDVNPGKADAEETFKAITGAHALLADPERRARFDRGEIDAGGNEKAPEREFYRGHGDDTRRRKYRPEPDFGFREGKPAGGFDPEDLESIFAQAFGGRDGHGYEMRGADMRYSLPVDFLQAVNGTVSRVTMPDGRTLDVTVPAGVQDGQVLRLKGLGAPGIGDGAAGDALVTVKIAPHPWFRREGNDVMLELPVTLKEAVLGAKVDVPTPRGTVSLRIPANSGSGAKLRLKGRGAGTGEKAGDQYVTLKLALPPEAEPELVAFLEGWKPLQSFDPRKNMVAS